MNVDNAISGFLNNYSGKTLEAYKQDLTRWLHFCISDRIEPMDAQPGEILLYLTYLTSTVGLAPSTARRNYSALRTFYGWLVDESILITTPFNDVKLTSGIFQRQNREIVDAKKERYRLASALVEDKQLKALLLFIATKHVHTVDATKLKLNDVFPETNQVSVVRRGSAHDIVVSSETMAAIVEWMEERSTHPKVKAVFIGPEGNQLYWPTMRKQLKSALEALDKDSNSAEVA